MLSLTAEQAAEVAKYHGAYRNEAYRMTDDRRVDALSALHALPVRGRLLDVGCGRGELLRAAAVAGFDCIGVEAVDYLCDGERVLHASATALPFDDGAFDVVTSFDVLEHILHDDQARVLGEMRRVARSFLVIAAASYSTIHNGVEFHVGRREPDGWERVFRECIGGDVRRCTTQTEQWVIDVR